MESRDVLIREEHFPMQIVCIYAMHEESFYRKLQIHLSLWQREGYIQWLETQAGHDVEQTMHSYLKQANLILLLISPSFFAHDLCYTAMKAALQEYSKRNVPVVPVLARASDWKESACGGLQALPENEQPLAEWDHLEQAYENIRAGLARFISDLSVQVDNASAEAIYRKLVVKAYQWLNFSGFDRPDGLLSLGDVPLEKIFVRLSLTVEKVVREPVPPDLTSWAKSDGSRARERVTTVQEPIELGKALDNHLLIVGEPGAGKSTLLRWLAVTYAQARQREASRVGPTADRDRLPILVELGHLPDRYLKPESREVPNWLQFLPEYLCGQMAFTSTPSQLLTQALAQGRCLLLFDGLDEVANREARIRLARSLADLARHFPGNRIIIGSRPSGVSESEGTLRPLFQRCQIERFSAEDVQHFFYFWHALDRSLLPDQQQRAADALMARVQAIPAILHLACTPLLATILLLIWRNTGDLPERRVDLYEYCCRVLIERWEASHDVVYQGTLSKIGWQRHLRLLTPLAYEIHSRAQRTSASRMELIPLLAQSLLSEGLCSTEPLALLEAEHFLDALSLRSGLLQYMGDDSYGFPHLTFQEYLAARHIAGQPDPDYIDMVMSHLYEAWWQQVHQLTIAHLGSSQASAKKTSSLILTILRVSPPPTRIVCTSGNFWLPLIGLGRFLPWVQPKRHIAWILAREFEVAARGYMECTLDGIGAKAGTVLLAQAIFLAQCILSDLARWEEQEALLVLAYQLSRRQGSKAVVKALLVAFHDTDKDVREQAEKSLEKLGAGNEEVMKAMLADLHDTDVFVQHHAAGLLGKLGAGNEKVMKALLADLHDTDWRVRDQAEEILERLGVGNEEVVKALPADLHNADSRGPEQAAKSLEKPGVGNEEVVKALLADLHDGNWYVQIQAAESLGKLGADSEEVVKALLEALHASDVRLQEQAAESLGRLGVGNEEMVKVLLVVLRNIWEAAESLGKPGVSYEEVAKVLQAGDLHDSDLYDTDWYLQAEAASRQEQVARLLGKLGAGNEEAVKALLVALHDTNWSVRAQAAESLGRLGVGNEEVAKALLVALHDRTETVVWLGAVGSLRKLIVGNEEVVKVLLVALHDMDASMRRDAAMILGTPGVGNEEVVKALLIALHDTDAWVQKQAAESLGSLGVGNEEVVKALSAALHNTNRDVQGQAAESLESLGVGNEEVVEALLVALGGTSMSTLPMEAAKSLGRLEIKDTTQLLRALVALHRQFSDGNVLMRKFALVSIRQLLDGRPIPSFHWDWVAAHLRMLARMSYYRLKRRLKRIALWLGLAVFMELTARVADWLLGPISLPIYFLAVLAASMAFGVAIGHVFSALIEVSEGFRRRVTRLLQSSGHGRDKT